MTKKKNTRGKRLLPTLAGVAIGLLAGAVLYLSFVPIDLSGYKSRIESEIKARSTHEVTLEGVTLRALPVPRLVLKGFRVHGREGVILYADNLYITVAPSSIYSDNLIFRSWHLEGAELRAERYADGTINIVRYARRHPPQNIVIRSLSADGVIHFTDRVTEGEGSISLTDVVVSAALSPGRVAIEAAGTPPGSGSFEGSLAIDVDGKSLEGEVSARDFDLTLVNAYIEDLELAGSVSVDGGVTLGGGGYSATGAVEYGDLSVFPAGVLPEPFRSSSGSFELDAGRAGEKAAPELKVTSLSATVGGFTVGGGLELSGSSPGRRVDLGLYATGAPFTEVKALIPEGLLPGPMAGVAGDITARAGTLTLKRLALSATLDEIASGRVLSAPDGLAVEIGAEGLDFGFRGVGDFSRVSFDAALTGDDLEIKGLSGGFEHGTVKALDATVRGLSGETSYRASVMGDFDAGGTLETIRALTPGEPEALKTLSAVDASGDLSLNLSVEGGAERETSFSGTAALAGVSFTYPDLPLEPKDLTGSVAFDNRAIEAEGLTGTEKGSRFKLDGRVEGYRNLLSGQGRGYDFAFEAGGRLTEETISSLASLGGPGAFMGEFYYDGFALVDLSITGTDGSLGARMSAELTEAQVSYGRLMRKGKNFPLRLSWEADYSAGELELASAVVEFGESTVELTGNFASDLSSYSFTISSERARLADLDDVSPFFKDDFDSGGMAAFNISGRRDRGGKPFYNGDLTLRDGRFETPLLASPVERVSAGVTFNGTSAAVDVEAMTVGDSMVTGTIDVVDLASREIVFDLVAPTLNTADLLLTREEREKLPVRPPSRPDRRVTGSGTLRVEEGVMWKQEVRGFFATIDLSAEHIDLNPVSAAVDEGRVTAEVRFFRDHTEDLLYRLTAELEEINLQKFFESLGAKKRILTGGVDGAIAIRFRRGQDPPVKGLNGEMALVSGKGKLWEFVIFSKIFSIVNIFSVDELFREGLQYKHLSAELKFTDGVMSTDNIYLDSDSVRISAVGSWDFTKKEVNYVLAMHPFVTIDKIVSNIPLAGWVLTGEEGSTVSLYFGIKGPAKNPRISPMPVRQIGKKVFGIFERLLRLPMEMLSPLGGDGGRDSNDSIKPELEEIQ